jgi:hypothetical protein
MSRGSLASEAPEVEDGCVSPRRGGRAAARPFCRRAHVPSTPTAPFWPAQARGSRVRTRPRRSPASGARLSTRRSPGPRKGLAEKPRLFRLASCGGGGGIPGGAKLPLVTPRLVDASIAPRLPGEWLACGHQSSLRQGRGSVAGPTVELRLADLGLAEHL